MKKSTGKGMPRPPAPVVRGSGGSGRRVAAAVLLVLGVAAIYGRILGHGFVEYDDIDYVTRNPMVSGGLSPKSFLWAFTTFHAANWHPLTWLSHIADASLFAAAPWGHHLTSLLLHGANGVLLFVLLRRLTGATWAPWVTAALFAVHPLHVESVAWVSERKDVLAGFFFTLTLLAWTKYVRGVNHPLLPLEGGGRVGVGPKDPGFVHHPPPTPPLEGGEQETRGHDPNFGLSEMGIVSRETRGHDPNSGFLEMGIVSPRTVSSAHAADSSKSLGHDPEFLENGNRVMSRIFTLNRWYILSLVLFALGLMAKPMLVTLPFVLLLLDWWPLGRLAAPDGGGKRIGWRRPGPLLLEKVPFLLLAAASSWVTWLAQDRGGATASMTFIGLEDRVGNALLSAVTYLRQSVWPAGLAFYYPHPRGATAWLVLLAAGALLAGLTVLAAVLSRRRPWLAVGWFWFLGMLVPVIGLVQVGSQAHADRYTYLPLVGLFLAAAWSLPRRGTGRWGRRTAAAAAFLVLAVLAIAARRQAGFWHDDLTLFGRATKVTKGNWLAHNSLGVALASRSRTAEAEDEFREALRLYPGNDRAWYNLGLVLEGKGDRRGAVETYRRAIAINGRYVKAMSALARNLAQLGENAAALEAYRALMVMLPADAVARVDAGNLLLAAGDTDGAARLYREATLLDPRLAVARNNLGVVLSRRGDLSGAREAYLEALRLDPGNPEARRNLAALAGENGEGSRP